MHSRHSESEAGYKVFDHTADIGLHVWARSFAELLEQAAAGLTNLLVEETPGRVAEPLGGSPGLDVDIACVDTEEGLVSLLQEILYHYEVDRLVTTAVEIRVAGPDAVRGTLRTVPRVPGAFRTLLDVKAATYHDLRVDRSLLEDGTERWSVRIVFDI